MVERYISLYSTAGEVLAKVRTELKSSDAKLKAKLYMQLPKDKQSGVDLAGVDFTGMTLENCRNCWFDHAVLTGATLINPTGSSFREAIVTGTNFVGDCRDVYFGNMWPLGIICNEANGMLIGGYSVDGEPMIAHMRAKNWWIFTVHQGRQHYFAFDEITSVTYGISDPAFTSRLIEMVGGMKDRMAREVERVREIYGNGEIPAAADSSETMASRAASNSGRNSPVRSATADDISRTLAGFLQTQSEPSMKSVPQMKSENAGDILNQSN